MLVSFVWRKEGGGEEGGRGKEEGGGGKREGGAMGRVNSRQVE